MPHIKNGTNYSDEERLVLLRRIMSGEISARALSKETGISENTFTRWKNRLGTVAKFEQGHMPEGHAIRGTSTLYDTEGNVRLTWVKTNKEKEQFSDVLEHYKSGLSDSLPQYKPKKYDNESHENLCCIIPIGDAHIGMWCPDWDLKRAEQLMCSAFDYLIDKSLSCDTCYIFNVGDYFHYHSLEGVTEKSRHVVDRSCSAMDMIDVGMRIIRYCIERALEKHSKVHVVNVAGNHDGLLAFMLSKSLKHIYEKEKRITVDDEHSFRHYARFGNNLFGIAHGDRTKDGDLPILMAKEKPQDWGQTEYRTWFRGHHHHDSNVEQKGGVYVRQIRTLAAGDKYATSHGFLSGRDIKCITYHKKYGWSGENGVTPEMLS